MTPQEFCAAVWAKQPRGYAFMGARYRGHWTFYAYDSHELKADPRDWELKEGEDFYFCPIVFSKPERKREYAMPSRWLYADLDYAPLEELPLEPSCVWRTSKDRHQALWLLTREMSPEEIEQINKRMTYAGHADKSGWDLSQLLRIPGTINFKRNEPEKVELLWERWD